MARGGGERGAAGTPGPAGGRGPVGPEGPTGPAGPSGPARWSLPTTTELVGNITEAALDLSPRTILDPRVGLRYVANLTTAMIRLPGGLLLRAVVTEPVPAQPAGPSNVRFIA